MTVNEIKLHFDGNLKVLHPKVFWEKCVINIGVKMTLIKSRTL